jgi:hypothetical protein
MLRAPTWSALAIIWHAVHPFSGPLKVARTALRLALERIREVA